MATVRNQRAWLVGICVLLLLFASAVPALADWQAWFSPFYHYAPFNTTVDGGEEDAQVNYDLAPGYRLVYAEGSYLTWTQQAIDQMVADFYCAVNYCDPMVWYETASVYHVFDKNTSNFSAALRSESGWSWSNLPGAAATVEHNGGEVRVYIEDPASMSASTTYYSQAGFWDTAYDGTTKTNAEVDYSTYKVLMGGIVPAPVNKDDNAKRCIDNDTASHPDQDMRCP